MQTGLDAVIRAHPGSKLTIPKQVSSAKNAVATCLLPMAFLSAYVLRLSVPYAAAIRSDMDIAPTHATDGNPVCSKRVPYPKRTHDAHSVFGTLSKLSKPYFGQIRKRKSSKFPANFLPALPSIPREFVFVRDLTKHLY
jgi:hypothetical protein